MFIGEFEHTLDSKGRLAVPAKFRRGLSRGAVVTRGLDHCLFLYDEKEWQKVAVKIATLPISQANMRAFTRLMLAGAMEVEIDSQGRIVLPFYLREYAHLEKEAVVTGLYNRIEIWDKFLWKSYSSRTEREGEKIAETLGALGV